MTTSHFHSSSITKTLSGGLLLALAGLLTACGNGAPGEESLESDTLARSSAAVVERCPDIPMSAGAEGLAYPCGNTYYCGDGLCRSGETQYNCPDDCGYPTQCGDGVCSAAAGESDLSCTTDCYCGDNVCNGSENVNSCPRDCGCPNLCGNGVCNNNESTAWCWQDCGSLCGDGVCNGGEYPGNCPNDCSACGDGVCSYPETRSNCPSDCRIIYCMAASDAPGMLPACPMEPLLEPMQ
jgi:hypothetical protein